VEEASQTFQFNHEVFQSSVEHIQQGISVLDHNLKLLAWNQRYIELFGYPKDFIKVGLSIRDLLRYNAQRGLFASAIGSSAEDVNRQIDKRIKYMQSGSRYKYLRTQENGQVIELNGSPLPGGGFVTTYSDISEYINIQQQLQQAKEHLEIRVEQRTLQLQKVNKALDDARQEAENANESKTKFLAAAGHDLMQPFNAASLFAALLKQKAPTAEMADMSQSLIQSLNSAEELLSMLLDMTKLESGVLKTNLQYFELSEVMTPLMLEFSILAEQKHLKLHYIHSSVVVYSDKKLLRCILQNLISNAIRYTQTGRILVGTKRRDNTVRLCVIDTGSGIAKEQQQEIFQEFHRQLDSQSNAQGLGLTIVERISALLTHPIDLHSVIGKGTCFSVEVPMGDKCKLIAKAAANTPLEASLLLTGKRILIVDNEVQILSAMSHLLTSWGASVVCATDLQSAIGQCEQAVDLMMLDYQLDHGATGVQVGQKLREK
jgi:signal transduction histidine kinase